MNNNCYDLLEIKNNILYLKNNNTYSDNVGRGENGWVNNKLLLLDGVVDLLIGKYGDSYTPNFSEYSNDDVEDGLDSLLDLPKNVMRGNYVLEPDDCKKIAEAEKYLSSVLNGMTPVNNDHKKQCDEWKQCVDAHSNFDEEISTPINITGLGMTKKDYDALHKKYKKNRGKFKTVINKLKSKNPVKLAAWIAAALLMLGGFEVAKSCDACNEPQTGFSETVGDKWDIFNSKAETTNGDELPVENPADKGEEENRGETAPGDGTSGDRVVSTTPVETKDETSSDKPGKLNASTNKNPQSNSGSQQKPGDNSTENGNPFGDLFDDPEMGD